jgi:5,10-methylenetetrahydrofolate reductase
MPLDSLRHAEYMANEVPGVRVPPAVIDRMRRAEAAGKATQEGLSIASELVAAIRPCVQGIQISAASGAIESALGIVQALST